LQLQTFKKIFVCEFITGGGLCNTNLPKSLAKEGALMRDALLSDLLAINLTVFKCQISTTLDARLPALKLPIETTRILANDDPWKLWEGMIKTSDAVLVIAPETDGILLKFAQFTQRLGKVWLGCSLDAIEVATDKLKTYDFLHAHGVSIPTFSWKNLLEYAENNLNALFENGNRFVAKPRDGAGCEDTFVFDDAGKFTTFMQAGRQNSHIIQLFIDGEHASFTMLCKNGDAHLLSCNLQKITQLKGKLQFKGSRVNGMAQHWHAFENAAQHLAKWLPGLHGLVGVDVIMSDKLLHIIEINPRLTTSYVGLHQAIGVNPAQLLLQTEFDANFVSPEIAKNIAEVHV
jgi:tyramine---L-glutamate ligase